MQSTIRDPARSLPDNISALGIASREREIGRRGTQACFSGTRGETKTLRVGNNGKERGSRENALTVINSPLDRIQIESLPANRVIVASAELLHTRRFPSIWKIPLVLNKCFTLADLPGIFICGVAARRCYTLASLLRHPPPP